MAEVAREVASRLGYTRDRAISMAPTAGFDCYATEGQGLYDAEADRCFISELKANLPQNIEVMERDTHIEDAAFATEAARLLSSLMEARRAS